MEIVVIKPKLSHIILAGSAALLLSPIVAAADTANSTVSSIISPVISVLTTSGTVNVNVTPAASGTTQTTASDTVTVSTNDSAGYTLTLADSDTVTNLASGGNSIAATTGTQAAPVALTAGKWGYRVDNIGTFGAGPTASVASQPVGAVKYAGVPASSGTADQIKQTATTATNDTTTVWYSVAVDATQPSGTYTDTVTYTATTR